MYPRVPFYASSISNLYSAFASANLKLITKKAHLNSDYTDFTPDELDVLFSSLEACCRTRHKEG
jgi:hypothetical protein